MLEITIPKVEFFDEETNTFKNYEAHKIVLEHSLVSLSKWESKWEIPFLDNKPKTTEQMVDYIRMMTISSEIPPEIYYNLSEENVDAVGEYIHSKQTATWFNESGNSKGPREVITSEVIYYWMVNWSIPFECQHWHLNRLLTLIKVCGEKNQPEKKLSKSDIAARNRRLNEERKAKYNTSG